ncbi:MAG: DUF1697 domain-containing protein [Byssovorax sp.]
MARARTAPSPKSPMSTQIALLRGVNVGGKNPVPMKELAALFAKLGCASVRTYIQSGNVVFQVPEDLLDDLAKRLAAGIAQRFGVTSPVVLRSAEAFAQAAARNPFLAEGADPDKLHLMFLAAAADKERVARLDPGRSPPDRFIVTGAEVYLHCPNGLARSKLTNDYFDRTLGTTSTVRNLRTVGALIEMTRAASGEGC